MFIKRSFHNFQGAYSCFVSSRMVYEEGAMNNAPGSIEGKGEEEVAAPEETKRDREIENVYREAQEQRAEHSNTIGVDRSASEQSNRLAQAESERMIQVDAKQFVDKDAESVGYKSQLETAKGILNSLSIETNKILTHLTPPVFSLTNSLQPKADSNGYYFVYIDIRNTPQDIKKNLENAAKMIIEEGRFLHNTPQEDNAADRAREKGMPFKNIRQAYVEDLKNKQKINWNGPAGDPLAPYSWVENDQKDGEWFNYAVETPAETADRIQKNAKEKEVKRRSNDEAKKIADDEAAARKAAIEEEANKEADKEDISKFKAVLDAYNVKREAFNQANGLKLTSHLDAFFNIDKGPYKLADIDEYGARLEGLSNGIDRFGKIFEGMSENTKNILKSVELIIDQEDEDKKDTEKNISRNADGSYRLWFDIAKDEKTVKKDIIGQKNNFVKGKKYTEDSPIEATQRAKAGAAFKNLRQAYQEKDEDKKGCITYNAKNESWEPSKGRKLVGTLTYDYSTEPIAPTPEPTPPPEPEPAPPKPEPKPNPEPAPETPYEAASTDSIQLVDYVIKTKQTINGKNKIDEFTLDNKIIVDTKPERINIPDGKVMALKIWSEDNKPIGYIYLDKTGKMKAKMESGYVIRIQDKVITVSRKREAG